MAKKKKKTQQFDAVQTRILWSMALYLYYLITRYTTLPVLEHSILLCRANLTLPISEAPPAWHSHLYTNFGRFSAIVYLNHHQTNKSSRNSQPVPAAIPLKMLRPIDQTSIT
jgi:hypothetical protein